jgi:hypothetical protein
MSTASDSATGSYNLPPPSQAEIDAGLEREIATAYLAAVNATDVEISRAGFAAMADLIAKRSPEQIARMEARLPEPWRS